MSCGQLWFVSILIILRSTGVLSYKENEDSMCMLRSTYYHLNLIIHSFPRKTQHQKLCCESSGCEFCFQTLLFPFILYSFEVYVPHSAASVASSAASAAASLQREGVAMVRVSALEVRSVADRKVYML